jgi:hypothetical protein
MVCRENLQRNRPQIETPRRALQLLLVHQIHVREWCAGRTCNLLSLRLHETLERELLTPSPKIHAAAWCPGRARNGACQPP